VPVTIKAMQCKRGWDRGTVDGCKRRGGFCACMNRRSDPKGVHGLVSSEKQQRDDENRQYGVEASLMAECRCGRIVIDGDCNVTRLGATNDALHDMACPNFAI
jgi:hypothetical protein